MTALLGRIEVDIWSGHHREVIGELEDLIIKRPEDGAVPRLLTTSLYLSERVAEAAFVCQQAIAALPAHGLNADPMEELQQHVLNRTLPRPRTAGRIAFQAVGEAYPEAETTVRSVKKRVMSTPGK